MVVTELRMTEEMYAVKEKGVGMSPAGGSANPSPGMVNAFAPPAPRTGAARAAVAAVATGLLGPKPMLESAATMGTMERRRYEDFSFFLGGFLQSFR